MWLCSHGLMMLKLLAAVYLFCALCSSLTQCSMWFQCFQGVRQSVFGSWHTKREQTKYRKQIGLDPAFWLRTYFSRFLTFWNLTDLRFLLSWHIFLIGSIMSNPFLPQSKYIHLKWFEHSIVHRFECKGFCLSIYLL